MNKLYFLAVLILFLASCENAEHQNKRIASKWNFVKSIASNCDDDESNTPTSCVFLYNIDTKGLSLTKLELMDQ